MHRPRRHPKRSRADPIGKLRDGDLVEIVIDRATLDGTVNFVGEGGVKSGAEAGARILPGPAAAPGSGADPGLPDDTRLWAALQDVSGGAWGGSVFDVEQILKVLAAGKQALQSMRTQLTPAEALPADGERATLIGRAWLPDAAGPSPVVVRGDAVYDLSRVAATCSGLLALDDPLAAVRAGDLPRIGSVADLLENSAHDRRDERAPWLIAPCDLQAVKASGVTFVASLLERVIEEQARGDAAKAEGLRRSILSVIGNSLHDVRPGSPDAARLKDVLIGQGIWSQYLEVGIGPDAEIFTKCPPLAVGRHRRRGRYPSAAPSGTIPSPKSCLLSRRPAASRARRSATTSTCATSRAAARCCSARPRTTTPRARSGRSSASSTRRFRSTTCGSAIWRCTSAAPTDSSSRPQLDGRDQPRSAGDRRATPSGRIINIPTA